MYDRILVAFSRIGVSSFQAAAVRKACALSMLSDTCSERSPDKRQRNPGLLNGNQAAHFTLLHASLLFS
jgi:hypothetical protein